VETVARLRSQITAKELQIGSMRAYSSPSNPDSLAEQELATLRSELAKLESDPGRGERRRRRRRRQPVTRGLTAISSCVR